MPMKKMSFISLLIILLGIGAMAAVAFVSCKEAKRNQQINEEIEAMKQEAEKIRKNNENLKEKISYFETPSFQESVAKEKLNLQKPDEQVVIVKPSEYYESQEENLADSQKEKTEENTPNYLKWWNQFFRH